MAGAPAAAVASLTRLLYLLLWSIALTIIWNGRFHLFSPFFKLPWQGTRYDISSILHYKPSVTKRISPCAWKSFKYSLTSEKLAYVTNIFIVVALCRVYNEDLSALVHIHELSDTNLCREFWQGERSICRRQACQNPATCIRVHCASFIIWQPFTTNRCCHCLQFGINVH